MSDDGSMEPGPGTPAESQTEFLTRQFYEWEKRGRGWRIWAHPVELEPPFRPFVLQRKTTRSLDDGRKATWVSRLADKMQGQETSTAPTGTAQSEFVSELAPVKPEPQALSEESQLVEIQVSIPPTLKVTRDAAQQFLLSLTYCSEPLSFELVALPDSINLQFACQEEDRPQLRQQLQAHFPDAVLMEEDSFLERCCNATSDDEITVVDFGLSHEFMRPLRTFKGFETDPLIGVAGALADLQQGEVAVLQVLFQPARHPWAESILRAVTDWEGKSFFADAPEMVSQAKAKIARPLFAAVIRVAVQSPTDGRAWQIAKALGGTLQQFSDPAGNELVPLSNDEYEETDHQEDLLLRRTRRSGMLLNADELVSLVHLPSASVRIDKLKREVNKTKTAPAIATGHTVLLGENRHAGSTTPVTLSLDQRIQHTYMIGASGTGKSTLLLKLIVQDIEQGAGVGVLDPHGDLIDKILGYIPEARFGDVVLLDPSDAEHPVGFNILSAHSELERNLLASDMVAVFRRLSTSWGDQMTSVLGNGVLAFLESEEGGTLADLRRFLVEKEFRDTFLRTVRDREIAYYWRKEYPLLSGRPQGPVLTRLDTFLRPKAIRHMVAQKENRLDIGAIMNEGKIFLAKLAQGAIGEENAHLLGTFLVSKFHQLALSRQEVSEAERRPFFLHIDEFHNFITPSMAAILAGARKYKLGLTLAHQDLRQLERKDSEVLGAVMANPYTRICFRVSDLDARKLEDGFAFFQARDLQNLGLGEAICRIERTEYDFNLRTSPLPPVAPDLIRERRDRLTALSRERYGTEREVVEAALRSTEEPEAPEPKAAAAVETVAATKKPKAAGRVQRAIPAATREESAASKEAPVAEAATAPLGRGGPQHRYLQDLVKRIAETRGFRAETEKRVLGGHGQVDVALETAGCSVACEISVTTRAYHEVQNLTKCLAAGFDYAILVCSDERTLERARALAGSDDERIRFLIPDGLITFLEDLMGSPGPPESEPATVATDSGVSVSPDAEKRMLTAKQAASYIGVARQTLAKMRVTGDSPSFYKVGRQVLYDRADLDEWLAERRRRSTSDPG